VIWLSWALSSAGGNDNTVVNIYDTQKYKDTVEHSNGFSLSFCTHFLKKAIKSFHNKFLLAFELKFMLSSFGIYITFLITPKAFKGEGGGGAKNKYIRKIWKENQLMSLFYSYMFRAHRPIFRRVRTAVHTTIGSVSVLLCSRAL